ncbi:hypothetical protein CTI12_AA395490 [Artemisia annua]|uniref:Uncharacterized protein n=1 Tax=Artemisia annua TaxID=35608 RepID=A0A2U1MCP9_ARTAN|nr:hypothetical protein CTI12_AA395490 [Artemisia annua]
MEDLTWVSLSRLKLGKLLLKGLLKTGAEICKSQPQQQMTKTEHIQFLFSFSIVPHNRRRQDNICKYSNGRVRLPYTNSSRSEWTWKSDIEISVVSTATALPESMLQHNRHSSQHFMVVRAARCHWRYLIRRIVVVNMADAGSFCRRIFTEYYTFLHLNRRYIVEVKPMVHSWHMYLIPDFLLKWICISKLKERDPNKLLLTELEFEDMLRMGTNKWEYGSILTSAHTKGDKEAPIGEREWQDQKWDSKRWKELARKPGNEWPHETSITAREGTDGTDEVWHEAISREAIENWFEGRADPPRILQTVIRLHKSQGFMQCSVNKFSVQRTTSKTMCNRHLGNITLSM